MGLKVMVVGNRRPGSSAEGILRLVQHNHPDVEFVSYDDKEKVDTVLVVNNCNFKLRSDVRRVLCLVSVPSYQKSIYCNKPKAFHHTIFISDYSQKVFTTAFNIGSNSVALLPGSLPSDDSMIPLEGPRTIDGEIRFLSIAKWFKRPYKRLKQTIVLYKTLLASEFPNSSLHIIGTLKERHKGNIHYYRKGFHDARIVDVFRNCHINIIPTPFDTGPKTIAESLHYRVPFVCSNNCVGKEYIDKIGKCGIVVNTDPLITSYKMFQKHKPLNGKSKYNRNPIPWDKYVSAIKDIVNNFEEYTSWKWKDDFNYTTQSDQWFNILKG